MSRQDDRRITLIDEPFVAVRPDGQRQSFQIVIYSPLPAREKDPWAWTCSISLEPLYRGETSCWGRSEFHALAAAITRATDRLSHFAATGGKILAPSGSEVGVPSLKLHSHNGSDAG
jgi:hypothetical protein